MPRHPALASGSPAEPVRFATGACALGLLLVATGERGLCAVALGEDAAALAGNCQARFPGATAAGGHPHLDALQARVARLVERPDERFEGPLDLRGTPFQLAIWRSLRALPAGRTVSYGALAAGLGRPGAARAVAAACAANPLALVIPCHRVVRGDGGLAGYRWGLARKRALLAREAALAG